MCAALRVYRPMETVHARHARGLSAQSLKRELGGCKVVTHVFNTVCLLDTSRHNVDIGPAKPHDCFR